MSPQLALVFASCFARCIQAYGPIQWLKFPSRGLVLMPQGFTGPVKNLAPPLTLTIHDPPESVSPNAIPHFSVKPDQSIVWEDMGWCMEAAGVNNGDLVRVNRCTGAPAQKWNWIVNDHNRNVIQLKDSDKCIQVSDRAKHLSGAQIELQDCADSVSSAWMFEDVIPLQKHSVSLSIHMRHVMMVWIALAVAGALHLGTRRWRRVMSQGGMPSNMDQEAGLCLTGSPVIAGGVGTKPCGPPPRAPAALMQEQQPQFHADETYRLMINTLLKMEDNLDDEVSKNYSMIDFGFLQRLESAIGNESIDAASREKLVKVKEAVTKEMKNRMEVAAATLKDVLSSPTAVIMEGKMVGMARQGKIDDALFSLLDANLQQAQQAGEMGKKPAAILSKLKSRVSEELDKKLDPAVALLRQLLRMDSASARQQLLQEKMAPKATSNVVLAYAEGEKKQDDPTPDVPPKKVAEAIKDLKVRFGNVDESYDTGFVKKLNVIADEAEQIALDLAGGKELSPKEQQDLMWENNFASVWDLGQIEEEAHQDGNYAVWEQEAQDQFARQAVREDTAQRQKSLGLDQSL